MAKVLIPGSFDPLHHGHTDVIDQALQLFGRVVVAVMHNPSKPAGLFDVDERVELATESLAGRDGVMVVAFPGLVVQAAEAVEADFIVKGLRSAGDFEVEQQMAQTNHTVTGIRTVFVPCTPALGYISSRFIREIAEHGGRVDHLVAAPVAEALARRYARNTSDQETT
jgi:pantetheine-phosphate adenylyltransferase